MAFSFFSLCFICGTLKYQNNIKHRTPQTMGAINDELTTREPPQPKPLRGVGGGFNAFYWYQTFALDYVVFKTQKLFSLHGGVLTIAMYHHREAYPETSVGSSNGS